jgi:hypothetical protein
MIDKTYHTYGQNPPFVVRLNAAGPAPRNRPAPWLPTPSGDV